MEGWRLLLVLVAGASAGEEGSVTSPGLPHTSRWSKDGKRLLLKGTLDERIAASTRREGDCLIWLGSLAGHGPRVTCSIERRHRIVAVRPYLWRKAQMPGWEMDRLVIHTICANDRCVALQHLSRLQPLSMKQPKNIEQAQCHALIVDEKLEGIRLWNERYTDVAIARKYELSRERVRQILNSCGIRGRSGRGFPE